MTTVPRRRRAAGATTTLVLALALASAVPAAAHRVVDRTPEVWEADERLLVVDSDSGDVVVLDDGREVERLSTPPAPISFARSEDGTLAFALRGRATDRDHVTIIDTAYDEATGEARRPYVARTFVGHSPGGVSHGRLPEVADSILVAEEADGEALLIDPAEVAGLGDALTSRLELRGPDHYAFVAGRDATGAEVLLAGHLRAGGVQVLDPVTREERAWYDGCPGLHGGTADASGERALFGCGSGVLVVPIDPDLGADPQLLRYPGEGRIASFHRGTGGVRFGTTEGGRTAIHRIDTTLTDPVIEEVDLAVGRQRRTALRTTATPDGTRLLVLTHQGTLQIRDGVDGDLRHEVRVTGRFDPDLHEHVGRAELPDLAANADHVHVSLPDAGRIVTVDLTDGDIVGRLRVDGMPTRMLLLGR